MHAKRRAKRRHAAIALAAVVGIAGLIGGIAWLAGSGSEDADPAPIVELALGDFFIGGDLTVPAGPVSFHATNVGREPHDVGIRGGKITTTLFAGQSTTLDMGELGPGRQPFCDVDDHVARGMVGTLTVTEPVAPTS